MSFLRHQLKTGEKKGKGIGFTLAASYDEQTATMAVGVAKCCKHDAFTKKKGREIALGRLENNPTYTLPVPPESDLRQFFNEQFDTLPAVLKKMNIKKLKEAKTPVVHAEPSFEIN